MVTSLLSFRNAVSLSAILAVVCLAGSAVAGEIRGRVIIPAGIRIDVQEATLSPYPGMSGGEDVPVATPKVATPADAVVYVQGAPPLRGEKPARPTLTQIHYSFDPRVLGIPVGTTVEFPNKDAVFHNVFSYSKTKRFDLGYYGRGKSKRVTFDKPGLVKVFCDIHSSMSAFILVVDSRYVTKPQDDGSFVLTDVPEGTWTLHVWHPERGEYEQQVVVGADPATMEIKL